MDVVSEVLPGEMHLFKGWAVAKAVVIQPYRCVLFGVR